MILQGIAGKSGEFSVRYCILTRISGAPWPLWNRSQAEPEAGLARRFTRDHQTRPRTP
jgi:hypothetical protein